ncbi:hypothetical protein [Mycolicibacterium holsaticum]|uniref:hypothetical protein n=1 Tax=Mycolicibacterium holsaticum TaxID=152142 RepID=UPI0010426DCE|nr:hypothetical protein [Mycolicibacterium holsaticum]
MVHRLEGDQGQSSKALLRRRFAASTRSRRSVGTLLVLEFGVTAAVDQRRVIVKLGGGTPGFGCPARSGLGAREKSDGRHRARLDESKDAGFDEGEHGGL